MTTVQFPREPDDALYEYLAEKAHVCGGGADEIWEGLCTRFGLQPAAEPVAWQHRVTAGPQTGWSLWAPGRGKEWAEHYTVEVRPLYAVAPTPPAKYDDTLLPFLALMRNELHANSHKGDREGWLRLTLEQALDEIRHHHDKLVIPVMNHDREAIREHAADVANCAMMLADIAGVLSRE